MRNIERANRAINDVSSMMFLEGRDCSFINGYEETFRNGNRECVISMYVDTESYDGTYIVIRVYSDGWNNGHCINVGSYTSIKKLKIRILDTLSKFRSLI